MADNDNQEKSEVEPTLSDLRGMLVVLQCSVNNILSDNQKLHEEMLALKLSVDTQGREFQKMKESVERITKENESLKNELLRAKGKLNEQKEEMESLWSSLDEIEQFTRKNSLGISGVPESCYTSTEEGKGDSLGSIERTNYEIGRSSAGELKPLHKLLYGRDGRVVEVKKNIKKFNGFAFEKDSKEYEAKKLSVERFTNDGLKRLCEIFDLEKKGKRNDLLEKVMDFLMSPKSSGRPAPQPKAKKAEKKKRKRPKKDTSKSKTPSKSKKTEEIVESGDDADNEDEEDDVEEEEEPPKKKKKAESSPKKAESPTKKAKETKVKDKAKDKDKSKEKSKKTPEKAKSPKKMTPVQVKITALKKASPKKTPKKEKPKPVDDSSSDEEPLAKKSKKQPPTNSELEKIVKNLLDGADLEQVTMKSVCKQVYDMFPEHDLTSRKDFIKNTVRKVIS